MLSALHSDVLKKLYKCTCHIYVLGPKLLRWNFFKSLSYLYEVERTIFSADFFGLFANFDRNFANIVAPSSDANVNCVLRF